MDKLNDVHRTDIHAAGFNQEDLGDRGVLAGLFEKVAGWALLGRAGILLIGAGIAALIVFAVEMGYLGNSQFACCCASQVAGKRALYLLSCLICVGVMVLWLLRARFFKDDLHCLEGFIGKDTHR